MEPFNLDASWVLARRCMTVNFGRFIFRCNTCTRWFLFSVGSLCLKDFRYFEPGSPSPSFLLGNLDIQLHFCDVSNLMVR